jgi:hypothetical protein
MKIGEITYENGFGMNEYEWTRSDHFAKLMKEFQYRGWSKSSFQYEEAQCETMKILKEVEKLIKSGVKFEYEPDVPNCRNNVANLF